MNIKINGETCTVVEGTSVAAAILTHGMSTFRQSVDSEPRGPVCGMGICYECRATIAGVTHQRSCMVLCRAGMEIETDA